MPEGFMWFYILLATVLAIMTLHNSAAIEAIFLLPLWSVAHINFFLKILKKTH